MQFVCSLLSPSFATQTFFSSLHFSGLKFPDRKNNGFVSEHPRASFCPHFEGDQPWDFFGRNDAKAEIPVLWPPHAKIWLIGKDSDAGRDWGQEEKVTTEDEMAGWRHWLHGRESEWTPGVGDGQGGLVCCDSWGLKELDTTERLIWSDLNSQQFWSVHRALRQWKVQWLRNADTGNRRPGSRKDCPLPAWRVHVNESTGTRSHAAEEMSLKRVFSGDFSEASSNTREWEQRAGFEPVGGCCLTTDCSRICCKSLAIRASQVAQWVRICLQMQEMQVRFLQTGRSPRRGKGDPLQYSCLGNPMGRAALRATVHGVAKSQTQLSD